jgi:hypothetical protein
MEPIPVEIRGIANIFNKTGFRRISNMSGQSLKCMKLTAIA